MKGTLKVFMLFILMPFATYGHEVRPAYLGIKQVNDTTYQVVWKIPALGEMIPKITPIFPTKWDIILEDARLIDGALRSQYRIIAQEPIHSEKIMIEGLSKTIMDVLVNIELEAGEHYSQILTPDKPFYKIPEEPSTWQVINSYLQLGINHILLGIDHLLFVLALIIVTHGKWRIVKTVTAFTIAHSITLSLAALGIVNVPIPPVEAIIALSIVFLAREILLHNELKNSLTYRKPWLIAFTFGLLHGFGFASALSETGLPQSSIPLALAFFNIGVEVGQILFVFVVLASIWLFNKTKLEIPKRFNKWPAYLIGSMATFWVIDRVVGFWG